MPGRAGGSGTFGFRPRDEGFNTYLRTTRRRFELLPQAVGDANKAALDYLVVEATKNLETHIRRHPRARTGRLKLAIESRDSHHADNETIQFMIVDRMNEKAAYWRAIEEGSRYWVGRRIPLFFLAAGAGGGGLRYGRDGSARVRHKVADGNDRGVQQARTFLGSGASRRRSTTWIAPDSKRGGTGSGAKAEGGLDFGVGSNRRNATVLIKNPVPAYGYGAYAWRQLTGRNGRKYRQFLRLSMSRAGVPGARSFA